MKRSMQMFAVSALAAGVAACGGGGDGSASGSTGTVSFNMTDAPAMEFTDVTVAFTGIRLKHEDGEWVEFTFDQPKTWNLLDLQGGMSEPLITDEEVPAGDYTELRLMVDTDPNRTFVATASKPDEHKSLAIPSGEQSGLKLKGNFIVAADTTTDFTIDFNVAKSIVNPQGQSLADYLLKPSLRLTNTLETGSITGDVDFATINQNQDCEGVSEGYTGSVYVYQGADITPTDVNVETEGGPLMTVPVKYDDSKGIYTYTAAYLTEGDYTISYTCQLDDNETTDDTVKFEDKQTVSVVAGEKTQADSFPLTP
ncbi:DUF4382 domain-containing protein [Marinobacter koreensis]